MRSTHLGLFTYGEQIGFLLKCVVYFADAEKSLSLSLSHLSCTLTHQLLISQSVKRQRKRFHSSVSSLLENVCCVSVFRSCASADLNTHTSSALSITPLFWHHVAKVTGQIGLEGLFNRSSHCEINLFGPHPPSDLITLIIFMLKGNYCLARNPLINLYPKWSKEAT